MWQDTLRDLIAAFRHPAWGISHSQRVYDMACRLAAERGVELDRDALLCAAYLHDLGALGRYRQPGVAHEVRSAALLDEVALPAGFPVERLPLVREIILGHDYRVKPGPSQPAVVIFHDADVLDFVGVIGVARRISVVGLEPWAPDLPSAIATIRRDAETMPAALLTPEARRIASQRVAEMRVFLEQLEAETEGLKVL